MEQDPKNRPPVSCVKPLTRSEIERRIRGVLAEVAGSAGEGAGEVESPSEPRWISAAELVRRVRRFMVYN